MKKLTDCKKVRNRIVCIIVFEIILFSVGNISSSPLLGATQEESENIETNSPSKEERTSEVDSDINALLENWSLRWLPSKQKRNGVGLEATYTFGKNEQYVGQTWNTTSIANRITPFILQTASSTKYQIRGGIDEEKMKENDFPPSIIRAFKNGFPEDWKSKIEKYKTVQSEKTSSKKTPNKVEKESEETPHRLPGSTETKGSTRSGRKTIRPLHFWEHEKLGDFGEVINDSFKEDSIQTEQNNPNSKKRRRKSATEENTSKKNRKDPKLKQPIEQIEESYVIEELVDSRRMKDGTFEFYVKWEGWPHSDNSWVHESDVNDQDWLDIAKEKAKKKLQKKHQNKKKEVLRDDDSDEEEDKEEKWSNFQLNALYEAVADMNTTDPDFWEQVANCVPQKTSMQCQKKYSEKFTTPGKSKKEKREKKQLSPFRVTKDGKVFHDTLKDKKKLREIIKRVS